MIADNLAGQAYLTDQASSAELGSFGGRSLNRLATAEHNPTGRAARIAAAAMQDIDARILQGIHQPCAVLNIK
jgi:hypothetical protein